VKSLASIDYVGDFSAAVVGSSWQVASRYTCT